MLARLHRFGAAIPWSIIITITAMLMWVILPLMTVPAYSGIRTMGMWWGIATFSLLNVIASISLATYDIIHKRYIGIIAVIVGLGTYPLCLKIATLIMIQRHIYEEF